jgi:hypothetical protein
MMEIPRPGELRELPVRTKENPRGLVVHVVFWFLRLLRWIGSEWAREVYEDFTQELEGGIWWFDGLRTGGPHKGTRKQPPSESLRGHESVHDWQRRTRGRLRHWRAYGNPFSRDECLELEAMASGFQVALHGRLAEERARVLVNGPYGLRTNVQVVTTRIEIYAERFREVWKP